jgi:hypothetical protein
MGEWKKEEENLAIREAHFRKMSGQLRFPG